MDASAIATDSSSSSAWSQRLPPSASSALAVPTRHGVHCPHDSSAKNFITLRAAVTRLVLVGQDDHRRRADEAAVRLQRVEIERNVAHRRPAVSRPRRRRANRRRTRARRACRRNIRAISSLTVMPAGREMHAGLASRGPTPKTSAGPCGRCRPWRREPARALLEDLAHPVERFHVVLERRTAEEPDLRDVGRAQPRHAALAFDRFDHRRFFAADVGARAAPQMDRRQRARRIGLQRRATRARGSRGSRRTRRADRYRSRKSAPPTRRSSAPSMKRCGSRSR